VTIVLALLADFFFLPPLLLWIDRRVQPAAIPTGDLGPSGYLPPVHD
jgi:hypothetical protein